MTTQYRYLLYASYIGTRYLGSQRNTLRSSRNTERTVQEAIEASLGGLDTKSEPILTSSSRTDRGVHCLNCGFTVKLEPKDNFGYYSTQHVMNTCNQFLSKNYHEIKVNKVILVPWSFHPQIHVDWREYTYKVALLKGLCVKDTTTTTPNNEPHILNHLLPFSQLYRITPLRNFNFDRAREATNLLDGYHNLASFTSSIIQRNPRTTWKSVEISVNKGEKFKNDLNIDFETYEFKFKSKSFLYQQIRRMVGCILSYCSYECIGLKKIRSMLDNPTPLSWSSNLIIAQPWGLYLNDVHFTPSSFFTQSQQDFFSSPYPPEEQNVGIMKTDYVE